MWKPYDPNKPPRAGMKVRERSLRRECIVVATSAIEQGTADPKHWEVWYDENLPDTVRSPEFKPKANICPCNIWRQDCDYHRD